MTWIISGQLMGWPVSSSTRAAASRALIRPALDDFEPASPGVFDFLARPRFLDAGSVAASACDSSVAGSSPRPPGTTPFDDDVASGAGGCEFSAAAGVDLRDFLAAMIALQSPVGSVPASRPPRRLQRRQQLPRA